MDEPQVKPGYLTTEFWLTLVVQGVALLVLFGFISKDEQKTAQDALAAAIENAAALAASAISIWKFIQSRSEVKTAKDNAVTAVAQEKTAMSELRMASMENRSHS